MNVSPHSPGVADSLRHALVVPVVAAVVGVELPVVRLVGLPPWRFSGDVEVGQFRRAGVRDAVDVGVDRAAVGGGIDHDRDLGPGGDRPDRRGGREHEDQTAQRRAGVEHHGKGAGHTAARVPHIQNPCRCVLPRIIARSWAVCRRAGDNSRR